MTKSYILNITGKDSPGITSKISENLSVEGVHIYDIEQASTHGYLSLSLIVGFEKPADSEAILKDLLFIAKSKDVSLEFKPVDINTRSRGAANKFAITLMSQEILPIHIATISSVLAKQNVNIDSMRKLNDGSLSCLEIFANTDSKIDSTELKAELLKSNKKFPALDLAVQREDIYRRPKRLVVMDMDSTLIQCEVIDELAKLAGVGEKVARITERAMNGEIDYDRSLRERVQLLKGLPEKTLEKVASEIPLTPGAETLIRTLKKMGYKIALISGGFTYFGEKLKAKLGFDYIYMNDLEIIDGKITGELKNKAIVNAERKADLLELIAQQEGIPLESTVAIGDGANDVLMIKKAGLGVAFNAKKKTQSVADASINRQTLASILYLLGISEKDA